MSAHPAAPVKGSQAQPHMNQSNAPQRVLHTLGRRRAISAQLRRGKKKKGKKKHTSSVDPSTWRGKERRRELRRDDGATEGWEQWRVGTEEENAAERRNVVSVRHDESTTFKMS